MRLSSISAVALACALTMAGPVAAASAAGATQTTISASAAGGVTQVAAARKPVARIAAEHTELVSGKSRVVVTSNAKKVQVRYRTANGEKRYLTKKVRKGTARVTVPIDARSIRVRAKATATLRGTSWVASTFIDTTPPGPVSGLIAPTVTTSTITLSWTKPSDADLAQVIVRRAPGSTAPVTAEDGQPVGLPDASPTSATDVGLSPATTYTYAVFTRDVTGNTGPAATMGATTAPAPAPVAAPPLPDLPTPVGYDVSWPQCWSALPTGQAFGIVGVNNGLANNTNPCLATQLAWAHASSGTTSQPRVALYVNTANPGLAGSWWPKTNEYPAGTPVPNPYGTCTGGEDAPCAYIYGYAKAYDDATIRGVVDPASYFWWLDVETENSWYGSQAANRADLEGMVHYFTEVLHAEGVGIYSTGYQWTQIVGEVGPVTSPTFPPAPSTLNGLPSWLAGASTLAGAQGNCAATPLTGGSVTVTQYLLDGLDHNYSCV